MYHIFEIRLGIVGHPPMPDHDQHYLGSFEPSRTEVQRQPNGQKRSLNHSRFGYYFLFLHCRDIRKIKNLEILEDLCVHWVAVVPERSTGQIE